MSQNRLAGFDVARSLAIFGMMIVHFMLVMTDGQPSEKWSDALLHLLDGRPAATFVILAGIGVTLRSKKGADPLACAERRIIETSLRRRGVLLLAFGFVNLVIWPGDILRIYGVSLMMVPWLVWRSSRTVIATSVAFILAFCVLLAVCDYDRNWDWNTMTYHHLWTAAGLFRSLFFDGFRSVFPWTGLLIFGLWLGRLDWSRLGIVRMVFLCGLAMVAASMALSFLLLHWLSAHPLAGMDKQTANALLGLLSMPPLPIFLVNASGVALVVISGCTMVENRWKENRLVRALAETGRMAFTWYVAHIVVGLGGVIVLGWTRTTHGQALATAVGFFTLAAAISCWWKKRFNHGPLEFLLRRVG